MNTLNFNQTGGFPLATNILSAMQDAYSLFNFLGNIAGNFAIIYGCDVTGTDATDGVVFINNELLPFKGGTISANVVIIEDVENRVFEDGSSKPVYYKRFATFGSSTANTFPWSNFKKIFPTTEIKAFKDDFETRITALEDAPSPVPPGMIAIWNKPASEPIPTGWKECTDLRGRVPVGWNPDDTDFSTIGGTLGEKTHKLTAAEMPIHNHQVMEYAGIVQPGYSQQNHISAPINGASSVKTGMSGGDQPHNNIQPSRIIRFIEFVG